MRKKLILSTILILIILVIGILICPKKENEIMNTKDENKNNMLSIMVESEAGTGNYNDASNFPSNGYYLNQKLSKCVNGSKISFREGSLIIKGNKSDRCYAYFDKDELGSICKGQNMAECFTKNYQKDKTIIYHDGSIKDEDGNGTDAFDYSYRYAGADANVKNYVCLDSQTTGECETDDDLYRIIGLFKNNLNLYEIKLIKYDYATSTQLGEIGAYEGTYSNDSSYYKGNKDILTNIGGYSWTSKDNSVNEWAGSALRETNLNEYYLNTYLKKTKHIDVDNLITMHTWSLNGHSSSSVTPKVIYDNEMDKVESSPSVPTQTKTIENKIGLMYVSDYGYAVSSSSTSNWTINVGAYYTLKDDNWMYMGLYEWTISRNSKLFLNALFIGSSGYVHDSYGWDINGTGFGVRPCFYLSTDIKLNSGNGTKENPYRITFE